MERLEYRCAARKQAVGVALDVALMTAIVAVLVYFLGPILWDHSPVFSAICLVILTIITTLVLVYAWVNFKSDQEFVCRIDNGTIEQICPIPGWGENFAIRIADVVKIERRNSGEGVDWYLWDRSGRHHKLAQNYGNPIRDFIDLIKRENEGVLEVRS